MSVPEGVRPSSTEIKNEDEHTLDAGEPFCQVPGCLAEEEPGQAKYYRVWNTHMWGPWTAAQTLRRLLEMVEH